MESGLVIISFALYGISFLIIGKNTITPLFRFSFILVGFLLGFNSAVFWVANYFTGNGFDESVVYHIRYGLKGAGFKEYIGVLSFTSFLLVLFSIFLIFLFKILKPNQQQTTKFQTWPIYFTLFIALLIHPLVPNLLRLYDRTLLFKKHETSFSMQYQDPVFLNYPMHFKNLVFIYAESLERTYFDENLFPDLIVGLRNLERKGISFNNLDQVWGTNFTISGLVANQCGIPLISASHGNSYSGIDLYLPGATCIGDLLRAEGYHLTYMGGASLEFAGKGKFLSTHGFNETLGRDELLPQLEDKNYRNGWGLFDDTLLDMVYNRYIELSQSFQPFGLFTLTLDTHHPTGHLSRYCKDHLYKNGRNPILNAVHCSDLLITKFVQKILDSPYAKNTLIVISSDHLAMRNTAIEKLEQGKRKNLLIILDPENERPALISKPGSMLDVAPTILGFMGFQMPALGLGRDLMQNPLTLVEQVSETTPVLLSFSDEIKEFWEHPSIETEIYIDTNNKVLRFNDRIIKVPALISFNSQLLIKDIYFEFNSPVGLLKYFQEMNFDESVLWIDSMENLRHPMKNEGSFFIFLGKIGGTSTFLKMVDKYITIGQPVIIDLLNKPATLEIAQRNKQLFKTQ